ncbi:metallophosphoesterase [Flexivirga caeni]|uniref:Metallophosphoesterase n=1 Tax=Flexivirga caeni TaxID=2294115 RepID=A0A3M9LYA6_9MICO|nr:metallophosphoesterase [Flexivirga caeni]RNI18280.1 metallophosphoesterase [Flexivirga caeni]
MHPLTKSSVAVAGLGLGTLAWASLAERHLYTLRRFDLPVLTPGSRPLRVLHLTDLHLVPRQERRIEWVRGLAALEPDFVINTGDNCSDPDAVPAVLRAMEPLLEFPGAFVLGSNDFYAPRVRNPLKYVGGSTRQHVDRLGKPSLPVQDLIDGFTGGGWTDLDNVRTKLEIRQVPVEFVGTGDPHIDFDDYPSVAGRAATDVAATIGVVHAPYVRVLDPMVADGAGLILAGHTHGGQVCVPGYGALTTNCDLDNARAKGVSRWWPGASGHPDNDAPADAAWLEVSAGLGHNKYNPVRLACRPEATLLTLVGR